MAQIYGQRLSSDFAARVAPLGCPWEEDLFLALTASFVSASIAGIATAEVLHGNTFKVEHLTSPRVNLGTRGCEICDLLVISHHAATRSVRATFLQAKRDSSATCPGKFDANAVQWSLLHTRAPLTGAARSFKPPPPPDLLQAALLPSIGSFGVFYRAPTGYDMWYGSADLIDLVSPPVIRKKQPSGVARYVGGQGVRVQRGGSDVPYANSLLEFGDHLSDGEIGSPQDIRRPDGRWLAGRLTALVNTGSVLAPGALRALTGGSAGVGASEPAPTTGGPTTLIVRCEGAPRTRG